MLCRSRVVNRVLRYASSLLTISPQGGVHTNNTHTLSFVNHAESYRCIASLRQLSRWPYKHWWASSQNTRFRTSTTDRFGESVRPVFYLIGPVERTMVLREGVRRPIHCCKGCAVIQLAAGKERECRLFHSQGLVH